MTNVPLEQKITGTLRRYDTERRFGFIARDDGGPDVFVSGAAFDLADIHYVQTGGRLAFVLEPSRKGFRAGWLEVID